MAASHELRIAATVKAGSGKTTNVLFTQSLRFENVQTYTNNFYDQVSEVIECARED